MNTYTIIHILCILISQLVQTTTASLLYFEPHVFWLSSSVFSYVLYVNTKNMITILHARYAVAEHVAKVRCSRSSPISWIRCAAVLEISVHQLFMPVGFKIVFDWLYHVCAVSLAAWNSTRLRSGYSALVGGAHSRNEAIVEISCPNQFVCTPHTNTMRHPETVRPHICKSTASNALPAGALRCEIRIVVMWRTCVNMVDNWSNVADSAAGRPTVPSRATGSSRFFATATNREPCQDETVVRRESRTNPAGRCVRTCVRKIEWRHRGRIRRKV